MRIGLDFRLLSAGNLTLHRGTGRYNQRQLREVLRLRPRRGVRLALWTPVPPQESGIADYSLELLRQVVHWADVEVFVDDGVLPDPEVTRLATARVFSSFAWSHRRRPFDAVLVQLGASLFHLYMKDAFRDDPALPRIVTLHDLTWGALLYREAALEGCLEAFRTIVNAGGTEGETALAEYDALASGDPAELPARLEEFFSRHLLLKDVAEASRALIVHMPRAAADLAARYPSVQVFDFAMGVEDPRLSLAYTGWNDLRSRLGISADAFVVGTFGVADPVKRLEAAVRALGKLTAGFPEADPHLIAVGGFADRAYRRRLQALAAELGLEERVRLLGRSSRRDFELALLASDAVVNLRYPFRGQMSATLMRALAAGRPAIVTDVPEWRHLPESFCLRVPADAKEVETLAGHLLALARDPARRRALGEDARRFWEEHATPARMAGNYRRVLEEVLGRKIEEPGR